MHSFSQQHAYYIQKLRSQGIAATKYSWSIYSCQQSNGLKSKAPEIAKATTQDQASKYDSVLQPVNETASSIEQAYCSLHVKYDKTVVTILLQGTIMPQQGTANHYVYTDRLLPMTVARDSHWQILCNI